MYEVTIKVNGTDVNLTGFPSRIIINVLIGMLNSLKDVDEIKEAVFELKTK